MASRDSGSGRRLVDQKSNRRAGSGLRFARFPSALSNQPLFVRGSADGISVFLTRKRLITPSPSLLLTPSPLTQ
jgi:hypothetical protein